MDSIFHFCQGESHKVSSKPCQDYALAESTESLSMAIISDGHGGERYFRSQHGSKLLVNITRNAVRSFVETIAGENQCVFEGQKFVQFIQESATDSLMSSTPHKMLTWLFSSIISQWNEAIAYHAYNNDLTDWELTHVEEKYREEFLSKRHNAEATFEKIYGCTLMAYVQTPTYWFAFHIGDGKIVRMSLVDEKIKFDQPVPWDNRCFLNKTTSICDSSALEEFRYCYQGDGIFPVAMFLGSDGLDDSYGDGEQLYNFYANLFKQIAKSGKQETENILRRSLPQISKIASKDDMSVACVYEGTKFEEYFYKVTDYQRVLLESERELLIGQKERLADKINAFSSVEKPDNKTQIDLQYAKSDITKVLKKLGKLKSKLKELTNEEDAYGRKLHPQNHKNQTRDNKSKSLYDIMKKKK